MAPAILMQLVVETERDQIEIAPAEPEGQMRGRSGIGDRIGNRNLVGDRLAGELRRNLDVRNHEDAFETFRGIDRRRGQSRITGTDNEATADRSGDVVRMALECGRPLQQVLTFKTEFKQVIGTYQAGNDRGRTRTHAAGQRNLATNPEGDPVRRVEGLERLHHQVRPVKRHIDSFATGNGKLAGLLDLELEMKIQCHRHHVVTRTKIGRRGRNPDKTMARSHPPKPIRNDVRVNPSPAPALRISDLVKRYPSGTEALRGVSLEIPDGEFFGLLGPNGAGKSTLIHCSTGLASPTSGSIEVFGNDAVTNYREAREAVGLAPQDLNIDWFLTVEETLDFHGGYFGMSKKDRRERVSELLAAFSLEEKRNNRTRELSGGMKRRLILARALMHRPRLLILDEPTAGVDVELRLELWHYVRQINEEGTTILLTTHYLEEAEQLCSRIAFIAGGQVEAQGTTAEIAERYGTASLEDAYLELVGRKELSRAHVGSGEGIEA